MNTHTVSTSTFIPTGNVAIGTGISISIILILFIYNTGLLMTNVPVYLYNIDCRIHRHLFKDAPETFWSATLAMHRL
jgi:hypothetical protein